MPNITVTEAASVLPTIIAAQALGHLKTNTVLAQLVARDWDSEVSQSGETVSIPLRGALSVNDKAANTVVTLQNPSTTNVDVTLDKHKEVSFLIEDIAEAMSRPNLLPGYVEDALKVISEQIDGDLASLYSGLSQTVDATAGLADTNFVSARRLLNAAKAPLRERYAVLHEDAEAEFIGLDKAIKDEYKASLGSGAMADAWTGRFMGFQVFMDQNIKEVTTEAKNMFFHRNAMVLVTRPLPAAGNAPGVYQTMQSEDNIGLRVTMSYSPNHLGWQVTIDVLYGVAELRDNHGVVVRTTLAT